MSTLLQLIRTIDPFEREHISAITITPGDGGYAVRVSINLYLPLGADPEGLPEGVTCSGFERYPCMELVATWRTPIWEQIMEVIRDAEMRLPQNLGTFTAAEHSRHETDGKMSQREAMKFWVVSTHGKPRSPERIAWIAQCVETSGMWRKAA